MMSTRKRCNLSSLCFYANVILLFYFASAYTDPLDVKSLEDLYGLLNQPPKLTGWMATGGDPCGQNWTGVSCSGSSIISIKISRFELGGTMSSQLSSFLSLTQLDMSYNNISGEIPSGLPPNATFINLAANKIVGNIPMSLPSLKNLKYLDVSNNNLFGVVGNALMDMTSLEILDLSYNSFSGDLPSSFGSLKNLHSVYLQHNQFTGSVNLLVNLPLTNLNIENNNFSGYVPKKFELIPELRIEGNKFEPYFLNRSRTVYPSLLSASKNVSITHIPKDTDPRPRGSSFTAAAIVAIAFRSFFVIISIGLSMYILIRRARIEEEIPATMSSPSIMSQPDESQTGTQRRGEELL